MAYEKQTFINNATVLKAEHLDHIEDGIYRNSVDKVDSSQLSTAVNNALAQAKESGEFKGEKGDKGDKGDKGEAGATGATGPTGATPNFSIGSVTTLSAGSSATATITGTAENPVLNLGIPKGKDGTNGTGGGGTGADGADGVGIASVVQTTTSTADDGNNIITVTLTDGTSYTFTVQNGSKGSAGADGKTPVRGTDYWTTADIAEIKSYVDNAILGGTW